MSLTREAIMQAADRPLVKFKVKEWGGDIYLKPLSGEQQSDFEDLLGDEENKPKGLEVAVWLVLQTVCDESGTRLFSATDSDWLKDKNAAVIQRVFSKAVEVGAASVDDAEKN